MQARPWLRSESLVLSYLSPSLKSPIGENPHPQPGCNGRHVIRHQALRCRPICDCVASNGPLLMVLFSPTRAVGRLQGNAGFFPQFSARTGTCLKDSCADLCICGVGTSVFSLEPCINARSRPRSGARPGPWRLVGAQDRARPGPFSGNRTRTDCRDPVADADPRRNFGPIA